MQRVDEVIMMESGWKGNSTAEISPNCPRCGSCNTKFCYYNNYSLTQPRYFCKACRRYWTKGGSLRNVPVGGGCRKSRRGNSKTSSSMHPPSRFLTDDAHNNFDPTKNNPSSSTSCDAPNIDLALVYANYLNQKPEPDHSKAYDDYEACVSVEYNYNYSSDHGPSTQGSTGTGCLTDSQLSSDEGKQMYFYGSMCMHKNEDEGLIEQQYCSSGSCSDVHSMNFELPPLPGEEGCAGLHDDGDMMWSSNNSAFHSTHPPSQPFDADLLISDWTHFDFPRP